MKNPCAPAQLALNQRRHDAHISPANSSALRARDYKRGAAAYGPAGRDWRQQIFGLQPVKEEEVFASYA
jgi:hypothetical protein